MNFQVNEQRELACPADAALTAAGEVITQLGGKRPKKPPGAGQVQGDFNKIIGGTAFGNRVQLTVSVAAVAADRCTAAVHATPVDPIGQPLRFGVLGDPARLVAGVFWDHLEDRLKLAAR